MNLKKLAQHKVEMNRYTIFCQINAPGVETGNEPLPLCDFRETQCARHVHHNFM